MGEFGVGAGEEQRVCSVSEHQPSKSFFFFFFFFLRQLVPIMANHSQYVALVIKAWAPHQRLRHPPVCADGRSVWSPFFFFFAQYCMYVFIQGRAREVLVRLHRKNGALQQESSKLYRASHQQALAALARA